MREDQLYYNIICVPIIFNNPIKSCFLNKKYPVTIKTREIQNVNRIFIIETPVLIRVKNTILVN